MPSDPAVKEAFAMEGIMVVGHPGQVRLLVDQAVVDLDESDVVAATELPSPPGLNEAAAQPVRLELRRGARLLDVGAAEAYEEVAWQRGQLFAMRTRREEPPWQISEDYKQLERDFFARYGIAIPVGTETEP